MVRSKIKTLGIVAVLMVLSVLVLYFAQALLMPKYMSKVKEGALIAEYYKAPKNNDVIFIGDCEVYENISPVYTLAGIRHYQAISAAARSS